MTVAEAPGSKPGFATEFDRAIEALPLGLSIDGLRDIEWEYVTNYDITGQKTFIVEMSGPNDLKGELMSWLDDQDWADWTVTDSDPGAGWATQRWQGASYVMAQEVLDGSNPTVQLEIAHVDQS